MFTKKVRIILLSLLVGIFINSCSNVINSDIPIQESRNIARSVAESIPLLMEGNIEVGNASISQADDSLVIQISVNDGYLMSDSNYWIGVDANLVPHNKSTIIVAQFKNREKYNLPCSTITRHIPIDWTTNPNPVIFLHVSIRGKRNSGGDAFIGNEYYSGTKQWNRYFTYKYKSSTYLLGGAIQGNTLNLSSIVTTYAGSTTPGSVDGFRTDARFNTPAGITTDGKKLFIADALNHQIREMDIATGQVKTIAGSTTAGTANGIGLLARFNSPIGITTDGSNLYIADMENNRIRRLILATGEVSTFAGSIYPGKVDGIGTEARFFKPWALTTDGTNLYVADTNNCTIRKVVISTREVSTLAGGYKGDGITLPGFSDGIGTNAEFFLPSGITTNGNNLYVADSQNHSIRKVVIETGEVTTIAGTNIPGSNDGEGIEARFFGPMGIITDGTSLYVSEIRNSNIRKIDLSTGLVTTIAGSTTIGYADGVGTSASFYNPACLTTDGRVLFVSDSWNHLIRLIE